MFELIFQGFSEWLYGLVLEAWEYFADAILDVLSLDFSYLEQHIPVITSIRQILLAGGWALLIGNLVFQAIKSMVTGLGFEGEDPKLLFTRTFVFSFLLMASSQICDICLDMTSFLMDALEVPDAVRVHLVNKSVFGSLTVSWLLVIIFNVIIMFQVFKLLIETAERYVILNVLTMAAPLAFGVGGSRSTSDIFTGWCRMYGSMCLLMATHIVIMKMLFSVLSSVPSGLDTLLWMVLILSIIKVAKKADSIITRIGLNPAFTGDGLRVVPGALSYVVLRQTASQITKALGKSANGSGGGRATGSSPPGRGPRSGGPQGTGGGAYAHASPSSTATSNPSAHGSKIASSPTATSNNAHTPTPIVSAGGGNPPSPGAVPPTPSPDHGTISPTGATPGSSSPHGRSTSPNGKKEMSSHDAPPSPAPQKPSGIPVSPPSPVSPTAEGKLSRPSTTLAGTPSKSPPGRPGKAGTTVPATAASAGSNQAHSPHEEQSSAQTLHHTDAISTPRAAQRQQGTSHISQRGKPDPGTAVTTQGRVAETRFSYRETTHSTGRASSLSLKGTKVASPQVSDGKKSPTQQASRFTARPSTPMTSGTFGAPRMAEAYQEHTSTTKAESERQSVRQDVAFPRGGMKAPSAVQPDPLEHPSTSRTTKMPTNHPGTAGRPLIPPVPPSTSAPRQGRNDVPTLSGSPTVSGSSSPAQQEGRLPTNPMASASPATSQPGAAGKDALVTKPATVRAPRQSRNDVSAPPSSPIRQENRPLVPAQPRYVAQASQSSPGTAGTAPPHGQLISPMPSTVTPARGGEHPLPTANPTLTTKAVVGTAKVTPAVKAAPKPMDTRFKKGYPAKPAKGGKKRHGQ